VWVEHRPTINETRNGQISEELSVSRRDQRWRAFLNPNKHGLHRGPRRKVGCDEPMDDGQLEPRAEQHCGKRPVRRSNESLSRLSLEHQVRDAWWYVRLGEPAHQVRGPVERRIAEHDVVGMR
jgi:hypothetical protein